MASLAPGWVGWRHWRAPPLTSTAMEEKKIITKESSQQVSARRRFPQQPSQRTHPGLPGSCSQQRNKHPCFPDLIPLSLLPSSCCNSIRAQLLAGRPGESQLLQYQPGDPGAAVHHLPSLHQVSPTPRPPSAPRRLRCSGQRTSAHHPLWRALAPEPGPALLPTP